MNAEFDEDTFFNVSEKRIELFKERTRLNEIISAILTSVSMVDLLTSERIKISSILQFISGILIKSNWNKYWHFLFGSLVSLQPVIRTLRNINAGGKNKKQELRILFLIILKTRRC